jgi:hypothetical protein
MLEDKTDLCISMRQDVLSRYTKPTLPSLPSDEDRSSTINHKTESRAIYQSIYIVGAQCSGKTYPGGGIEEPLSTLKFRPLTVILRVHNFTRDDIRGSRTRYLDLQILILEAQSQRLASCYLIVLASTQSSMLLNMVLQKDLLS